MLLDPRNFLWDPNIQPWYSDQRQDLLADNVPQEGVGKYVVFERVVPEAQVYIVKAIAPYAQARVGVDPDVTSNETFTLLTNAQAGGFFSWQPVTNNNAPVECNLDWNSPKLAGGTLNNKDRQNGAITWMSDNPYRDIYNYFYNPLFSIVLRPGAKFQIIFSLLPVSTLNSSQMTNVYNIGGTDGARRVDFAGCAVAGLRMSAQHYEKLAERATRGEY